MDPAQLQQAFQSLLEALTQERDQNLSQIDLNTELGFSRINNRQNARGLLFSTQPSVQQSQLAGEQLQRSTDIRSGFEQNRFDLNDSVVSSLDRITSLQEAARLLNERPF